MHSKEKYLRPLISGILLTLNLSHTKKVNQVFTWKVFGQSGFALSLGQLILVSFVIC